MSYAPAMTGLRLVDPDDDSVWNFQIKKTAEEGQPIRVNTVPWEDGVPGKPWVRDLFPFVAGAARTKDRNPLGLSLQAHVPADTFSPDQIVPGPAVTALAFTNATVNATKMIHAKDNAGTAIFAICGRYLIRVSSTYVVASTDLGASVVATDIVQINNEVIICNGASTFIKRRNAAGTITTSGDVYAHSIVIVGDRIWKVRNSSATVNNVLSYLVGLSATDASALTTLSSWTTPNPAYLVGDNTYQCVQLYDNGGTIAGGRADGIYMPNPEYKFLNVTPQIKRAPDFSGDTGKGCWSAFGYFFVPYHRGVLRCSPGFAEDIGIGTLYLPKVGLRVRDGLEWDRQMYVLCSDERDGSLYLFRMAPDKLDVSDGEYVFHPVYYRSASTTQFGRSMAMLTASTNPTLVFGGGAAATAAQYIKLGRGSGRDIDDANYTFSSSPNYVTTGLFTPVRDGALQATLVGSQVWVGTTSGATTPVSVQYSASPSMMPGDNPTTNMTTETLGSEAAITTAGKSVVYAAPNSKGHFFNLKLTLKGTGTMAPAVLGWRAFGYLAPETTDQITVVVDLKGGASQLAEKNTKHGAEETYDQLSSWVGKIVTGRLEGYKTGRVAEGKQCYFFVRDVSSEPTAVKPAAGGAKSVALTATVVLLRVDFANDD